MFHLCIVCWCFNCTWYKSSQSTKHQFAPEMCIMRTSCCALLFVLTWHFSSKVSQACCEPPPTTPTRPPTGAIGQSKQNGTKTSQLKEPFNLTILFMMPSPPCKTTLHIPKYLHQYQHDRNVVSKCYSGHFLVFLPSSYFVCSICLHCNASITCEKSHAIGKIEYAYALFSLLMSFLPWGNRMVCFYYLE